MQNDMFFFLIALVKKRSVKKLGKTHVDSVESWANSAEKWRLGNYFPFFVSAYF